MPRDPERERDQRLRRLYNITAEQYDELLEHQGGVCAICEKPPGKTRLAVDHDHKTGLTRGLLCFWCNRKLLPASRENARLLQRGADYLNDPPAVRLLGEVFGTVGRITKKRRRKKTTKKKETVG